MGIATVSRVGAAQQGRESPARLAAEPRQRSGRRRRRGELVGLQQRARLHRRRRQPRSVPASPYALRGHSAHIGSSGIALHALATIRNSISSASAYSTPTLTPHLSVPLPSRVDYIKLGDGETQLVVGCRDGSLAVWDFRALIGGAVRNIPSHAWTMIDSLYHSSSHCICRRHRPASSIFSPVPPPRPSSFSLSAPSFSSPSRRTNRSSSSPRSSPPRLPAGASRGNKSPSEVEVEQ